MSPTSWYWHRDEGARQVCGGQLAVSRSGEVYVNVDDDYYSGHLSQKQARELLAALKAVFENTENT